ncbi:MAG: ThuA domain-containing protein [Halobacteriales archaeon]
MTETIRALAIGETTFGFHSFDEMGPLLRDAFDEDVSVTTTTDRDDLRDLGRYDVLVDYLTDSTLTDAQHDGLFSFVRGGGGYVGVHCASDLTTTAGADGGIEGRDEPFPAFRELIGGHFLTHPEQQEIDVEIVDRDHPITEGVDDFTVYDEPYQVDVDDDVHLLARMDMDGDLADMPVAWTRTYGEGRVFYLSLGHTEEALEHPAVGTLLSRGARWASGSA